MNEAATVEQLLAIANSGEFKYSIVPVVADDIVFEERVRLNCFYCAKYGQGWKCPPKIPALDYPRLFREYGHLALVYARYSFTAENYAAVRAESTNCLHRTLLSLEKFLWGNGNSLATSFIGGSCKLCKNGCGKDKCNNPYLARSPLEATGCNVVATAAKQGIQISFPPADGIIRMGLLMW